MKTLKLRYLLSLLMLLPCVSAWAWGRRGHSIVCQTAAYLVAGQKNAAFLKNHSFDLGYYCNVPDFFWKDATYKQEWFNHFMDLEMFDRALKGSSVKNPFALSRHDFNAAFPQIPNLAGRAWWRIREMNDQLQSFRQKLLSPSLSVQERHALQAEWMMRAGFMGHYVGDLSMPLHVSENHDGQLTHQKGVHSYFEDAVVNDLFHSKDGYNLESEAWKLARKKWAKESSMLAKKSVLELVQALSMDSAKNVPKLLRIDREVGRLSLAKADKAYRKMITDRLATGAVYLAELYRRAVGFNFDDNKFYNFIGEPKFIPPPK